MAQGRSLLGQIFKNFRDSLKPKGFWGKLIGKDQNGTEYYEDETSTKRRSPRWFVPRPGSDFTQEIPVEWQAWLRHKRKQPPTEEEIAFNKQKLMAMVENAKKLEKSKTIAKDEIKTFDKPAFPTYEEYSANPLANEKTDKQ